MDFGGLRGEGVLHINVDILFFLVQTLSKKRSRMVETPTAKRIHSEPDRLWRIVTDYPDIFDSLIVPKLNGNDVKFFFGIFRA